MVYNNKNMENLEQKIQKIEERNQTHVLRFRAVNQDIFEAIRNGKKKIETRAATKRYKSIRAGDTIRFLCEGREFKKRVRKVMIFKSITSLLKKYRPKQVNPRTATEKELRKVYYSFPAYREKLKKCGLIAIELK